MREEYLAMAQGLAERKGLSDKVAYFIASQLSHETGDASVVAAPHNHGGISTEENTGYARPEAEGGYYKAYGSDDEFIEDYWNQTIGNYGIDNINAVQTPEEWAMLLKDNGYYTDTVENYAGGLRRYFNEYTTGEFLTGEFANTPFFGDISAMTYQPEEHYDSPIEYGSRQAGIVDSFLNQFYNNGTISMLRTAMVKDNELGIIQENKVTEDAKVLLKETFKDRPEVTEMILNSARNDEQIYRLMAMKQEDLLREARVDNTAVGWQSIGSLAGLLADPLNFVPMVGQEALVGKALAKLGGKTLASIGGSKVAQIAEVGLTNGVINSVDQKLAKDFGGFTTDETTAFVLGAGAGAGLSFIRHRGKPIGKESEKYDADINAQGERAVMNAMDIPVDPNVLAPQLKADFSTLKEKIGATTDSDVASYALAMRGSKPYKDLFEEFKKDIPELTEKQFHQQLRGMKETSKSYFEIMTKGKVIGGVPHSKNSMVKLMEEGSEAFLSNDEIMRETQKDLPKVLQQAGQWLEKSKYFGDRYGQLTNSKSKAVRELAKKMLFDPRQRGNGIESIELLKKASKTELTSYTGELMQEFGSYLKKNIHIKGLEGTKHEFNNAVHRAYHDKYYLHKSIEEYPEEIQKAVDSVKRFREAENKMLSQAGIVDKIEAHTDELWRKVDTNKVNLFRTKFSNEQEAEDFLEKYIYTYMEKDKIPEDANHKVIARELAKWYLNTDDSLFSEQGDKFLGYYKKRVPMDTDGKLILPNGELFSFNDYLRDTNILDQMNYVTNRSAGAVALKLGMGIDNIGMGIRKMYQAVEEDLKMLLDAGEYTKKEVEEQLKEVRYILHNLSGAKVIPETNSRNEVLETLRQTLLTNSYAQNGMNFGLAQVSESMGAISVSGAKALTHYIPALHDYLHNLKNTKYVTAEQLQHFKDQRLGYDLAEHIWSNPEVQNVDALKVEQQGLIMKALGKAQKIAEFGAKVTSTINQVTKLTNLSRAGIKGDVITDMIKWSRGEFKSTFRDNLFNDRYFAEVGIKDTRAFKATIQKYLGNLGDKPDALVKAVDKWKSEDLHGYLRMLEFLDITANRAILEASLSNTTSGTKGLISSMFFQFKNFSRMAINGHLMRSLSHFEKADFVNFLGSGLSSGLVWAMRVRLMAETKYDNEKDKKKYLDKTLTPENLFRAGIFRSSIGSGLSYFNDIYEGLTGTSTIRTSVNRTTGIDDTDLLSIPASIVSQIPAIQSLERSLAGAKSIGEIMFNIKQDEFINRGQAKALYELFPLDRIVVIQGILAGINDEIVRDSIRDIKKKKKEK